MIRQTAIETRLDGTTENKDTKRVAPLHSQGFHGPLHEVAMDDGIRDQLWRKLSIRI